MKLSLLCQHQGWFPTVIMVGPRFEQRQISVWNGLPHQLVPITAQRPFAHDYELHHCIFFFLIGNQKYPPYLWLILDQQTVTSRLGPAELPSAATQTCLLQRLENARSARSSSASRAARTRSPEHHRHGHHVRSVNETTLTQEHISSTTFLTLVSKAQVSCTASNSHSKRRTRFRSALTQPNI